tara:strand:+ start:149 stop:1267 length:1119 start_codon:yes stop_codon:yes gene_type:complete
MVKFLIFDKGGRKERENLIKDKKAPRDFLQGLDVLKKNGYDIDHLSSSIPYKKDLFYVLVKLIEQFFSRISNCGIRPLSVFQFMHLIKKAKYVVSLTDGFSISLGFYFSFINKKNNIKLAGAFHKLSDYQRKIPRFLKYIYYKIFLISLNRLDYIIFYGEADRLYAIDHFKLEKGKTHILKFGVDTLFWEQNKKNNFLSNYLFSIGQDPSRDYKTLLSVKTKKLIHIHTNLLPKRDNKYFKITNGSYQNYKNSFTDLSIKKLYQESFAVIVPLKNVFQPSGYSVTLQAMACGKPVILTLTKGLWAPKIFKNLENCLLVKPKDKKDIEKAIKFLENNELVYKKVCLNARKTAVKYFSLDQANNSTLELFSKFN